MGPPAAFQKWWSTVWRSDWLASLPTATLLKFWAGLTERNPRAPRYRLIAFVHESNGDIKYVEAEGTSTMARIFIQRPSEYRWGVMEKVNGRVILTDLYELLKDDTDDMAANDLRVDDEHTWEFDHADAAIAAAVLKSR